MKWKILPFPVENPVTKPSLLTLTHQILLKDIGSRETLSYIANVWVVSLPVLVFIYILKWCQRKITRNPYARAQWKGLLNSN